MLKCRKLSLSLFISVGLTLVTLTTSFAQNEGEEPRRIQTAQTDDDTPEDGKPNPLLREFMRQKLKASNMILEGLTTEDMVMVKEGSQKLNSMSHVEQWRVHNDVLYKQFSGEFQRVTKSLIEAAENDNIDKAAFQWMAATMSCIECHRYVRNELVVGFE